MPDTITLQVARYRPEHRRSRRRSQEYEVPLREDWAVLDGLNYIKDQLDGTLSFRWSCRMGICGSCGMMVNGEPELTCGTFLTDYAPGPVRVEPLANFPVIRDLVVEIDDFLRKLPTVQPWLVREQEQPVSPTASSCRRPAATGRVQAVQHVHQLHALLRGLPGVRHRAGLPRPGGDRARPAVQPRLPRRGRPPAVGRARRPGGGVGLHLRR